MNEKIKELRKRSGLSQKEAAKILGVAVRTLQDWESGARNPKDPGRIVETLEAMLNLTRDGINAILDGDRDTEWALWEKKISDVQKLSKWGRYSDTFYSLWHRIPTSVKHKLTAEELAGLVDTIRAAYDDGRQAGHE